MNWNPFDWTAEPFLTLYVVIAAGLLLLGLRIKLTIGPGAQATRQLSELELAYLAGGAHRLGDAALLGLSSKNAATIDAQGRRITVTNQTPLATLLNRPLDLSFEPGMTRQQFQKAIAPLVERVQARLQALGYCPTEAQLMSFRMSILPFLGLLIMFGIMKTMIGVERHHPIGFLLICMLVTLVASILLAISPVRTRAGKEVLQDYRATHARVARAPRDHELLLAVALAGPIVLSGTAYASVYAASQTMNSSGGDGGSGCGGGGGGGGGCGGCS